ncbi:MAG: SDR family NAD(P)-dependent oxidoreductase, partial [Bacteroidota bacterium]
MKSIQSKCAVVTGAAIGIGRAISLLLAENGAKVIVSDVNETAGKETVADIES